MKKNLTILLILFSAFGHLEAQNSPTPAANELPTFPAEQAVNPSTVPQALPASEAPASETTTATSPMTEPVPSPAVPEEEQPAPYPTTPKVQKPATSKTPRVIPKTYGDTTGEVFIGQRTVVDRYAGWGWVRSEKDSWRKSRWTMLEEKPRTLMAPGRFLAHPDNDKGTQYKLYGQWAPYKGYEPNFDVFVDVFQIKGFEVIGPAEIPKMSPPRSKRGRSDNDGPYQRRVGGNR
jgi:hypothetical protein